MKKHLSQARTFLAHGKVNVLEITTKKQDPKSLANGGFEPFSPFFDLKSRLFRG